MISSLFSFTGASTTGSETVATTASASPISTSGFSLLSSKTSCSAVSGITAASFSFSASKVSRFCITFSEIMFFLPFEKETALEERKSFPPNKTEALPDFSCFNPSAAPFCKLLNKSSYLSTSPTVTISLCLVASTFDDQSELPLTGFSKEALINSHNCLECILTWSLMKLLTLKTPAGSVGATATRDTSSWFGIT